MITNKIKVLQLIDVDGNFCGLYLTERDDEEQFQEYFDAAFSNEDEDIQLSADDWLETHKQIFRTFATEIYTNKL